MSSDATVRKRVKGKDAKETPSDKKDKKKKEEFKPRISEEADKKRTREWMKKSDDELDALMKARRIEMDKKSERALTFVITLWLVIVFLVLVHIASVINVGYAKNAGRPIPKHFLRYISDPLLPLGNAVLEAAEPLTKVLVNFQQQVLHKLKL